MYAVLTPFSNRVCRSDFLEEVDGLFGGSLALGVSEVDVEEAEPLVVSLRPLEVVQQGPAVVTSDVHSILGDRCNKTTRM